MSLALIMSLGISALAAYEDPPQGTPTPDAPASVVQALEDAFASAIAKAEPSVVAIARTKSEDGETRAIKGLAPERPIQNQAMVDRQLRDMQRFNQIQAHAFELVVDDNDNLEFDYGSGVVVGSEGQILTAYHVVKGAKSLTVRAAGRQKFDALIIAADPRSDLAVIVPSTPAGMDRPRLKPIQLGDSTKLRKGSFLIALGNPYNAAWDGNASAAWGILANISRRIETPRDQTQAQQLTNYPLLLQLDAKLNLGMSGAAVVNLKGELVGLTTNAGDPEGFDPQAGYAFPIDRLGRRAVEALMDGREVEYGFLGIRLPTPGRDSAFGKTNIVSNVTQGTPADLGGLINQDEIVSVGDYPVFDSDTLIVAVGSYPVGSIVKVTIIRDGKKLDKMIPLSKFPTEGPIIATNRPKAWRGIRVDYTSTLAKGMLGVEAFEAMAKSPVSIVDVTPDSFAEAAGLRKGQILLRVAGKPVRTPADFSRLVQNIEGDATVTTEMGDVVIHSEKAQRRPANAR
jgi:serine protease Do